MMKTFVCDKDGSLSVREVPKPKMLECQALTKTLACGICGSDTKILHRDLKIFPLDYYPVVVGHEAIGRVVEVGSECTSYKVGDIVMMPTPGKIEGYGSAWGAFSEYGLVNDCASWNVGKYGPTPPGAFAQKVLPPDIDPVSAVMIITLREVRVAVETFRIKENESTVVFGCGPVGLAFIRVLKMLGVGPIIALDFVDSKLEDAKKMGADYTFNNSKGDEYKKAIQEMFPGGVRNVLDAVGVNEIMNIAMGIIQDNGKICVYGVAPTTSMHLDWTPSKFNWEISFQQMPDKLDEARVHRQVMNWVEAGVWDPMFFISDVFSFEDIIPAFEKFLRKENDKKIVIKYE